MAVYRKKKKMQNEAKPLNEKEFPKTIGDNYADARATKRGKNVNNGCCHGNTVVVLLCELFFLVQ